MNATFVNISWFPWHYLARSECIILLLIETRFVSYERAASTVSGSFIGTLQGYVGIESIYRDFMPPKIQVFDYVIWCVDPLSMLGTSEFSHEVTKGSNSDFLGFFPLHSAQKLFHHETTGQRNPHLACVVKSRMWNCWSSVVNPQEPGSISIIKESSTRAAHHYLEITGCILIGEWFHVR